MVKSYNELNPVHVQGDISVKESKIMQPVDIQARYSQTIQTHNAVSVTNSSNSVWIDTNGFDSVGLTFTSDFSNVNQVLILQWSNDANNSHGAETFPPISGATKTYETKTKARYVRVQLQNGDATAHIMSAWAYLKA